MWVFLARVCVRVYVHNHAFAHKHTYTLERVSVSML